MSDIERLRGKMDEITLDMLKLLKMRMDVSREIGDVKKTMGMSFSDENREDELRDKMSFASDDMGLDNHTSSRFLNFLLNESIKEQAGNGQSHLSIFRRAKSLEAKGKTIIHMEVGETDFAPPAKACDALGQACSKGFFKYGLAGGMPIFRDAVARYVSEKFNTKVSAENILASPGARFSVFSAISTLLNPGDEMIVIEPAWPAYKECALYAGIKVRSIHTTMENNWEPSYSQIQDVINPNTKMIVLNYPNNPTGKILPQKLQDDIMRIAIDHSLYVLSDEIYSDYAYKDWKSIIAYNYEKSIITQSFSKSHAMTGFRIGYSISSADITRRLKKIASLCLTNVSEPIQYAAIQALDADISGNVHTIRHRLDILSKKASDIGLDFIMPDGAMYLYARVNQEGFDGVRLAESLLDRGLAIAPGVGFGDYPDFIRISACQKENVLMQGMIILGSELREIS